MPQLALPLSFLLMTSCDDYLSNLVGFASRPNIHFLDNLSAVDIISRYTNRLIIYLIIYMKKLLDSDWLRAVQFKCNTVQKSVIPAQITHQISGL